METGKVICIVLILVALFLFGTSLHRVYKVKGMEGFYGGGQMNVPGFDGEVVNPDGNQRGSFNGRNAPNFEGQGSTATAPSNQQQINEEPDVMTQTEAQNNVSQNNVSQNVSQTDAELLEKIRHHSDLINTLAGLSSEDLQKLEILTTPRNTGEVDQDGNPIMESSILNKLDQLQEPIKEFNDKKELLESAIGGYSELSEDEKNKLNNIMSGLTDYKDFHDEYNQKLEQMLENRFQKSSTLFHSKYDLNKNKIDSLKKKLDELKGEVNQEITSNNIISIKNLDNGERLNMKKITQDTANPDGSSAQRYLIFANNNCLSFNGPREYGLKQCEMTDQSQHFLVDNIKNNKEYEVPINIIKPDGIKKKVTEFDDVSYDFNLVYPYNSVGSCLSINEKGMQFVPCSIENNQRFNVSDRASAEKCN